MAYDISEFVEAVSSELPEIIEGDLFKTFATFLQEATTRIMSDKSFYRWENDPDTLRKMLREFRLEDTVKEGSDLWDIFLDRADLIWTISRLSDTKDDVEIFYKNFGVTDVETFLPLGGVVSFDSSYTSVKESLKDRQVCSQIYKIVNTDYADNSEFVKIISVFFLYTDFIMSVCKEIEIKLEVNLFMPFSLNSFTWGSKHARYSTEVLNL